MYGPNCSLLDVVCCTVEPASTVLGIGSQGYVVSAKMLQHHTLCMDQQNQKGKHKQDQDRNGTTHQ